MVHRFSKVFLTWACLQLQLAIGLVPATGLAVCVGPGGHFDLEAPHAGHPCHSGQQRAPQGCVDVVIKNTTAARPAAPAPVPTPPALVAVVPSNVAVPRIVTSPVSSRPPDRFTGRLNLRTVILLV